MSFQHLVIAKVNWPPIASKSFFNRLLIGVAAGAVLTSLGCTRSSDSSLDRSVIVALSAEPATLDPRVATDATGTRLAHLMFSSIVRVGPDLDIVGEAASDWSYDAKLNTYRFNLKPGIRFHSKDPKSPGTPLTANDILFTFRVYKDPKSPFASALKAIDSVEAIYDVNQGGTLALKLDTFSATLLTDLSPVKLLPQNFIEQADSDFKKHPIGTGSFQFVSADSSEIRLRANPHHFDTVPKVDAAIFKIVREDNTRVLKLQKGEIDIAQQELPQGKIPLFESSNEFQVFKYPGLGMNYVLVNLKDEVLKKKAVREGLSLAIDRELIIRHTLNGLAQPATSLMSPVTAFYDNSIPQPQYELDKAKALLKSAGADTLSLTLKTTNSPQAVENGRILANQLEKTGLKVNVQSFEWGTFYEDLKKGNYQLATARWVGVTDPDLYRLAFHSQEVPPTGRNRGFYSNPKLDQLVEQGLKISDPAQRVKHYKVVQKLVSEEIPIIPLWYDFEVAVVRKTILDYRPSKNGDYSALTKVQKQPASQQVN